MSHPPDVVVFEDAKALASGAADRIAGFVNGHSGTVTIGMAGGSTPAATYAELANLDVPWHRVYAWVGDERYVSPEDDDNNGSMVRRQLLDRTQATFFPVPYDGGAEPRQLAQEYESTLIEIMNEDADGPRPDLLLAGIGDDGHTLSLFPGTDALEETDRWFVANWVAQKDTWRLTTTYPLAWRSRQIYVLVAGAAKAPALAQILSAVPDEILPARRLMEGEARVTWLVDTAAMSLVDAPA